MEKIVVFVLFSIFLLSFSAVKNLLADEKEEKAREHFKKARLFVEEEDYEKAIIEFEESFRLNPEPVVLYNIAVCYDALGKYANALEYYHKFLLNATDIPDELRQKVLFRAKEIKKYLGKLKVQVNVDGAWVFLDNQFIGLSPVRELSIEAGVHEITLKKKGWQDLVKQIRIVSGQRESIFLEMKRSPQEKRFFFDVFRPYYLFGLAGGTALIIGGIFGWQSFRERKKVEKAESQVEAFPHKEEAERKAMLANVFYGIGTATVLSGAIWFAVDLFRKRKKERRINLYLEPRFYGSVSGVYFNLNFL